jgi:hypothetical protein
MKNILRISVLSIVFSFTTVIFATESSPFNEGTYKCSDTDDCPTYAFDFDDFSAEIEVCSNRITGTGYIYGNRGGSLSFSNNGKGFWVAQKDNGIIGFKLYINQHNYEVWYKLGHVRGIDDHRFNWTDRIYIGTLQM